MSSKNLFLASSVDSVATDIFEKVSQITQNSSLVFITTASEVEKGSLSWLHADRQALIDAGFRVQDYTVTGKSEAQVSEDLKDFGSICVAGGNNYHLTEQARKSGFDVVVKELVANGIPYIGSSAGSVLAGPNIETELDDKDFTPQMVDFSGLRLTDIVPLPHWTSENFKRRYEKEVIRLYHTHQKLVLLNDSQYLWVKDEWYQVVDVSE